MPSRLRPCAFQQAERADAAAVQVAAVIILHPAVPLRSLTVRCGVPPAAPHGGNAVFIKTAIFRTL